MKRFISTFTVIIIVIVMGCSCQQGGTNENKSMTTMRISAILPDDRGYWRRLENGLMSGAESLDVDIKAHYPYPYFDIPQMTELIKAATAARVDAIIVQGTNDAEYLEALNAAAENGILIAFVDTDAAEFSKRIYVGTDNYAAGRLMAEKLAGIADGQTNVVVLMGGEGFPNLDSRLDGFRDGISADDSISLIDVERTNFDTLTIIDKYRSVQKKQPAVNAIVCLDGTGGPALSSVVDPSTASSVNILCFDLGSATRTAIQNGLIAGTIVQHPSEMGETSVQELYKCFIGKQSPSATVYTDISFITAADLEEAIDED